MDDFRVRPDDDISYFEQIYLGPHEWTFPWAARYTAYGVFFGVAALWACVVRSTTIDISIVRDVTICVIATCGVMYAVDHDKPLSAVLWNLWRVLTTRAPKPPKTHVVRPVLHTNMKVRTNREGTHV